MSECVFCKIVAKELPSDVVYEDDAIIAFRDINPVAPVHILVIPKRHIKSLQDTEPQDEQLLGALLSVARKVASEQGLEGYRVATNIGKDGGQVIEHLHFHVIGGRPLAELPSLG
ncbi:MAG: histidine triad nucleotide-binding protein [Firmicutes bacterium]|nr:histidine triad nucleotide-binding protein [Bacillota bacterium]